MEGGEEEKRLGFGETLKVKNMMEEDGEGERRWKGGGEGGHWWRGRKGGKELGFRETLEVEEVEGTGRGREKKG